ncbi:unnamed protein product [Paramecium sonneborni]|uniref:Uncharacterized protein n=1 Tax=Paramecium sonneborni TaxID=65129 RepID=A0A8S1RL98_9CILI|nr:unnamed protein product [Paramecium sonneborni]
MFNFQKQNIQNQNQIKLKVDYYVNKIILQEKCNKPRIRYLFMRINKKEFEEKLIFKTQNHQQKIEELKKQNMKEYKEQISQLRQIYDLKNQKIEQKFMEEKRLWNQNQIKLLKNLKVNLIIIKMKK